MGKGAITGAAIIPPIAFPSYFKRLLRVNMTYSYASFLPLKNFAEEINVAAIKATVPFANDFKKTLLFSIADSYIGESKKTSSGLLMSILRINLNKNLNA